MSEASKHEINTDQVALPEPVTPHTQSHVRAWVMCSLIAFCGFTFGWDTGSISGIVNMPDFIERFGTWNESTGEYSLSSIQTGLITSIMCIGAVLGGLTLSKLGDKYGRRLCMMMSACVYGVGILIQITSSTKWYQYVIGRVIMGLAIGCNCVVGPNFISEISPGSIRGAMVTVFELEVTAAIFLAYCVVYACNNHLEDVRQWRVPVGLCFAWMFLTMVGLYFAPESPRFLVSRGKVEEAQRSLCRIYNAPENSFEVKRELDNLESSFVDDRSLVKGHSWSELIFGKPKIGYRVFVGLLLQCLQQLTGINYFLYYATTLFQSVGLKDSYVTSIIMGLVNFVTTFPALYVIDHYGRRKTLLVGSAGMTTCLLLFSVLGTKSLYHGKFGEDANKGVGDAMIVFTCIFIMFFAITWAPGVWVVVSESYPIHLKARAAAIAMTGNWSFNFLIAFFTPFISKAIHFAYGFVFFGCTLFSFFFVYTCVPETKGMALEKVDDMYRKFTPGLAFRTKKEVDV